VGSLGIGLLWSVFFLAEVTDRCRESFARFRQSFDGKEKPPFEAAVVGAVWALVRDESVVFESLAMNFFWLTKALACEAEYGCAIDETIDGGDRGRLAWEEGLPFLKPCIGRKNY
jgi:hypothetical protein